MSTKTYTLTQDAEGHKIRKCSEYVITDEAGKVKAVSLLSLDGTTPIPLNKNFTASNSPITAESYATLISNASQVTDKTITISTESAKMLSEYCRYRGQQTRNLAYGGSYSGTSQGASVTYDNGIYKFVGTPTATGGRINEIFQNHYISVKAGVYTISTTTASSPTMSVAVYKKGATSTIYATMSNLNMSYTFTLTEDVDLVIGINFDQLVEYNNEVKVQLEKASSKTDFVPPLTTNTTIADANAKGFKVCTLCQNAPTKNLCPSAEISNEKNGVTYTYTNGVYSVKGTSTSSISPAQMGQSIPLKAGTYRYSTISDSGIPSGCYILLYDDSWTRITTNTFTLSADGEVRIGLSISSGKTIDGTIKVQIEKGTTTTEWVAPLGDVTYELTPSRTYDDVFYPSQNDSGEWLAPAKLTNEGLLNLTTFEFTPM